MNYFEGMIINIIFLLFPLFLYVFYIAHLNNLNKKENSLFLSLALVSSLYLVMRYGTIKVGNISLVVLFDLPILIAYVKKQPKTAVGMSIFLILYHTYTSHQTVYFALVEYVLYFIIYLIFTKKNLNKDFTIHGFVLTKTFFLAIQTFYQTPISPTFAPNFGIILLNMILFYLVAYIVIVLLHKGEEIIDLNQSLKDLEKEKFLRTALFKITHEIKNPIAVCKGYLDMLDLNDHKKIRKYIPIVQREIERTLNLMDDYSTYAKKIKVDLDIMDLYYLLEDTMNQLESLFEENGIEIKFHIPTDELYIEGDYNRLKQVLINIFKNAVEAKDETKKMTIKLEVEKQKDSISLKVSDNGKGMDDETLRKVSELFFTTKPNGTGLGVALSKEIIELHHGTINYASELGKGTTVTITLPLKEELNEF